MNGRATESTVVGFGVAYLVALTWAMANVSYDIWGAFVIGPVLVIAGVAMLRRLFRGKQAEIFSVMVVGLVAKLAGGIARYWVSFDAYGGGTDAQRYHQYGAKVATDVWGGDTSVWSLVPRGIGTEFLERFTAVVYTLTGWSRLGGFFVFAWIAYWGIALMVKAAIVAIPGLARRRYALLATLAPSIVFWPSSIGKEAYMFLTLGVGTFGLARLVSRPGVVVSFAITLAGLGAAAFVRPHIVAVWVAGAIPALLVVVVRGRSGVTRTTGRRATDAFAAVLLLVVASVALLAAARATVDYLDPAAGDETQVSSTSLSDILAETTRRTGEQGSTYTPPAVDSPTDWPFAIARTIFRPLIIEARGLGQLLAAVELTAFIALCAVSWQRVRRLPREMVTNPYVAFAMATLLLAGLAYSSFANLGVLTRQKSLIFPFLLLIPCLPEVGRSTRPKREVRSGERGRGADPALPVGGARLQDDGVQGEVGRASKRSGDGELGRRSRSGSAGRLAPSSEWSGEVRSGERRSGAETASSGGGADPALPVGGARTTQKSSTSPSESAQLASGGAPASLTARQVRTGPPPGRGNHDEPFWRGPMRMT